MKTLIVARTKAGKQRCIGGIAVGANGYRSVRLMNPDNFFRKTGEKEHRAGGFWSKRVPFQIGEIWDLEIEDRKDIKPPHVEDVVVRGRSFDRKVGDEKLASWLKEQVGSVRPQFLWKGGPWTIFDGKLESSKRKDGTGYITENDLPQRSTGFWIPNRDLVLQENRMTYRYQRAEHHFGVSRLKHIGESKPVDVIPSGTLVRVSLSRWYEPEDSHYPNACWLMMSEWYS